MPMPSKLILSLAMSLDGYIADDNGGYDWIVGDGDATLDTKEKWDYAKFLEGIGTVVMGKKCYDQGMHKDFVGKHVFVATSQDLEDFDNIRFIKNIVQVVEEEKQKEGKDIFLFGGGVLVDAFLKTECINEYFIGIIPVLLGHGRPLFFPRDNNIKVHLQQIMSESGIVVLRYTTR